jgi:cyclin-dependent kinase 7
MVVVNTRLILRSYLILNSRVKDKKVGEGTYAVVYQGACQKQLNDHDVVLIYVIGREASTGRKVAIKKIKVGQFKDGLDMSAIREVKYLRELKHQNVIEACMTS